MKNFLTGSYLLNLFLLLLFVSFKLNAGDDYSPLPSSSNQIILVVTDSTSAVKGILYCMDREDDEDDWQLVAGQIPVVLGRSGLGAGIGLHKSELNGKLPDKKEGDGRSPAGVFTLSHVFGYKPAEEMIDLKMPYIHITEVMECIDDISSGYYNQIVSRSDVEEKSAVDWNSSEKMRHAGIYYELGVVVDHNSNEIYLNCLPLLPDRISDAVPAIYFSLRLIIPYNLFLFQKMIIPNKIRHTGSCHGVVQFLERRVRRSLDLLNEA